MRIQRFMKYGTASKEELIVMELGGRQRNLAKEGKDILKVGKKSFVHLKERVPFPYFMGIVRMHSVNVCYITNHSKTSWHKTVTVPCFAYNSESWVRLSGNCSFSVRLDLK